MTTPACRYENAFFAMSFMPETIVLTRQARDEHRGKPQNKEDVLSQHRPGWDDSYHCETSVSFCTGEYTSDLSACCPEACGLCPVPRPPPPPHAPDSPGGGSSAAPAEFPTAKGKECIFCAAIFYTKSDHFTKTGSGQT
jgi:hypothetical protein